ncbi:MAG: Gfo/Idh/MocA family oxidoreductase [Opitutales bacterium]|nr:Gfo/Idh/MocA family oxidoreductase [Opitutales bacterium]
MNEQLKVIIIGAGFAGSTLHLPAYQLNKKTKVCAVVDFNEDACKKICYDKKIEHWYKSYEEAVKIHQPDIVSISTPPKTHFPIVENLINKVPLIILEKPIFSNTEEAYKVMELAKQSHTTILPVHNKLCSHGVEKSINYFKKGYLGDILQFNAYWMNDGTKNHMTKDPNHWSHSLNGGRWEELIPHPLYIAYHFMGPLKIENVAVQRSNNCLEHLNFDEITVSLSAKKGFVNIRCSATPKINYNFFQVLGTKESLFFDTTNVIKKIHKASRINNSHLINLKDKATKRLERMCTAVKNTLKKNPSSTTKNKHGAFLDKAIENHLLNKDQIVSWEEAIGILELTQNIGDELKKLSKTQ